MGREIRRVPAGWEHPRRDCRHSPWDGGCSNAKAHGGKCFQPLYDRDFESAAREWMDGAIAWDNGSDPDTAERKAKCPFYWQWHGAPPNAEYYRPKWTDEERTHFQVYETVSEGTPVSPVFATEEEVIDYLVEHGDYWDQLRAKEGRRERAGWTREAATQFVTRAWAPSLMVMTSATGTVIHEPRDGDV